MMVSTIARCLGMGEERRFNYLLMLMFTSSLIDAVGIASIMPFVAILSGGIDGVPWAMNVFHGREFDEKDIVIILGGGVFALFLLSISLKAFTVYSQHKFMSRWDYLMSEKIARQYAEKNYEWYLDKNSQVLGKNILSEVSQVLSNAVMPYLNMVSHGMTFLVLMAVLLYVDYAVTIVIFLLIGVFYALIFYMSRSYLDDIGAERYRVNEERFLILGELFSGIKSVKINSLENYYVDSYLLPAKRHASLEASSRIVAQLPRYFLELVLFGGILVAVILVTASSHLVGGGGEIFGVGNFCFFGLAGYRMLPALQQIYSGVSQIKFSKHSVRNLIDDLCRDVNVIDDLSGNLLVTDNFSLEVVGLSYKYPGDRECVFEGVDLKFTSGHLYGITGVSGCGKSTFIDVLVGLLEPWGGRVVIDFKQIKGGLVFEGYVGYAPQHVFISDTTIMDNIIFGRSEVVDQAWLNTVIEAARISEFIDRNKMVKIGENGCNLSGGQRQRIGIARAIYTKPKLLVLDESTAGVDRSSESAIIENIRRLLPDSIIVIVTHSQNALAMCDYVISFPVRQAE